MQATCHNESCLAPSVHDVRRSGALVLLAGAATTVCDSRTLPSAKKAHKYSYCDVASTADYSSSSDDEATLASDAQRRIGRRIARAFDYTEFCDYDETFEFSLRAEAIARLDVASDLAHDARESMPDPTIWGHVGSRLASVLASAEEEDDDFTHGRRVSAERSLFSSRHEHIDSGGESDDHAEPEDEPAFCDYDETFEFSLRAEAIARLDVASDLPHDTRESMPHPTIWRHVGSRLASVLASAEEDDDDFTHERRVSAERRLLSSRHVHIDSGGVSDDCAEPEDEPGVDVEPAPEPYIN